MTIDNELIDNLLKDYKKPEDACCRDAEWLVTKVEFSAHAHRHHAVHCVGADDLVRGHGLGDRRR